jgi:hypothetical protein
LCSFFNLRVLRAPKKGALRTRRLHKEHEEVFGIKLIVLTEPVLFFG